MRLRSARVHKVEDTPFFSYLLHHRGENEMQSPNRDRASELRRIHPRGRATSASISVLAVVTIIIVMVSGSALATYNSFTNVLHDWAPCSGYNHYDNPNSADLGVGEYSGDQVDQAQYDGLCGTDTTEHEVQSGIYSPVEFTVSTTAYYTISASFSGSVGVSASETQPDSGDGHAWFEVGVGVKDVGTGWVGSNYITPAGLSITVYAGASESYGTPGSVSGSFLLTAGHTYDAFAAIDVQDGSSQGTNQPPGIAQAAVVYSGACVQNGACGGPVYLVSLTFP